MKLSTAKTLMKFWKNAKSEVEKMKFDGTIKLKHPFRPKESEEKKDS